MAPRLNKHERKLTFKVVVTVDADGPITTRALNEVAAQIREDFSWMEGYMECPTYNVEWSVRSARRTMKR